MIPLIQNLALVGAALGVMVTATSQHWGFAMFIACGLVVVVSEAASERGRR